jgi:hypothetical protein
MVWAGDKKNKKRKRQHKTSFCMDSNLGDKFTQVG